MCICYFSSSSRHADGILKGTSNIWAKTLNHVSILYWKYIAAPLVNLTNSKAKTHN